jgi:rod shape-determining protein MreD
MSENLYRISRNLRTEMRIAVGSLSFILLAILQTTLVSYGQLRGTKPDLLFAFVVYCALFYGRRPGMITGFLAGLFLDLYEPMNLGLHALVYTSMGFLIGTFSDRLYRERILSQFLTLFLASLLGSLFYALLLVQPPLFLHEGILQSFYTSIVGVGLFILFNRFSVKWKKTL